MANKTIDPFSKGVWIMTMIGNRDIVAMIDGSDDEDIDKQESEKLLKEEMNQFRSICVILKRKYIFYQISFPMKHPNNNGFVPANMAIVGKHEILLELENEFATYAALNVVTFISDMDEYNLDRIRRGVVTADEGAKESIRAARSNIVVPRG